MGVLSALFGGGKSSSTSSNRAFDQLQRSLTPAIDTGVNFLDRMGSELDGGFDAFKKNSGFDFLLGEGLGNITGARAAQGNLRSGAATKDYGRFITGLGSSMFGNYLDRLGQVGQLGLGAAGTLAGAGGESKSQGKNQGGIIPGLFG